MTLQFKTVPGFVSDEIATWSAQLGLSVSFSSGDPLLAFWQSISVQLDYLQAQIALVLALARAQTSSGADLDTWMAQFNFVRLPAVLATGTETLQNPNVSGSPIAVPLGTIVQTIGGGIQYEVVADAGDPTFDATAGAYIMAVGQTTLNPTVQALVAGSAANVLADTLVQFGSSAPGIATCFNPSPIDNGQDAESDDDFRARFVLYLSTLAKATQAAILAAALSVQQGLLINLEENIQPNGTPLLGSFTVIADDGSGNPPASLLNAIYNAVWMTRAFSVQPFVIGPSSLLATITLAVRVAPPPGIAPATINTAVQNAIADAVNALAPGATLYMSAIVAAALAVTSVVSIYTPSLTINGATADLTPTAAQEVRTAIASISVTNY